MDVDLSRWRSDRLFRLLILLVGVHSCVLGVGMLVSPRLMLRLLGFPGAVPLFFPSQSGIFMLILGILYLGALVEPAYVWTIIVSKALAVVFLLVHVALLSAPPIIWAAGAGDAAMLIASSLMLARHKRLARAR
ncbi:MAG: hypothetical protein WC538_06650 [Thermoanaerobaculia bacterium]|jgi:hypothetical protein